jgi:hypothetical protein
VSWLYGISARSLRHLDRLEIDLTPAPGHTRRHLVLLGPNGSGKSILLDAIADELARAAEGDPHPAAELAASGGNPETIDRDMRLAHFGRAVRLTWARPAKELRAAFEQSRLILAFLPDPRETSVSTQASRVDTDPKQPRERVGGRLSLLLTNRRTELELAQKSNDEVLARAHLEWFARVEGTIRRLLHQPELVVAYDRDGLHLDLPDGRRMQLDQLSRGHASAIAMWAEVMMRVEAARLRTDDPTLEPAGVVLIDGAEEDLEVRLQREFLPTLAELFPRVQLVVTTHSPLVALSLDDAIVYDLGAARSRPSEDVRRGGFEGLLVSMLAAEAPPTVLSPSMAPPPPSEHPRPANQIPVNPIPAIPIAASPIAGQRPASPASEHPRPRAPSEHPSHAARAPSGPPPAFTPPGGRVPSVPPPPRMPGSAPIFTARAPIAAPSGPAPPWSVKDLGTSSEEITSPGAKPKQVAPKRPTQRPGFTAAIPPHGRSPEDATRVPLRASPGGRASAEREPGGEAPGRTAPWTPEIATVDSAESLPDEKTSPDAQPGVKKPTLPPPAKLPPKKNAARKARARKDTLTGSGPWGHEDE